MSFLIGETVGAYRITEQLGSGGMATVFKAYHAALDRYVAIKVLHPAFKEDPNFLARFQREARVVAKLEHPNIVPVHDFSEHNGQPYLVMRFIEGETLKARLARGPLSMAEALKVIHLVGAALTYAHGQGVLHRDIKPSNVIITSKGDVFLTDFGLARIAQAGESTLSTDSILGTPQYISPEQAKGERDLDARTDVYSLGVVVYELLVGRVPYQADTPFAVVHDHIFTPLPMPRSINPSLPEPLERFLLKTLSKNRDDRFASVQDMTAALSRAVDEAGITLPGSTSTVVVSGEPSTVVTAQTAAAPSKPATPEPVATTAAAKKPVRPIVWIGLGALIVMAIIAVVLIARPKPVASPSAPTVAPPSGADQPPPSGPALAALVEKATTLFRDANDQILQGQPDRARDMLKQAADVAEQALAQPGAPGQPEETSLRVIAAEAWLALGQPQRANPHLKWLIESQPDNGRVRLGAAVAQLMENRIDDAIATSDGALAAAPDLIAAHAIRGCALLKKGNALQAAREFKLVVEADASAPGRLMPWMRLVLERLDCRLER